MTTHSSVAIAADDLTGASDTVAVFAQRGWRGRVALDAARLESNAPGLAQALDTHSRATGLERRTMSAVERHLTSADVAFLKIDSLLRGQWASGVHGLAATGSWSRVLVAPAFPAQARTVREGRVDSSDALETLRAAGLEPAHIGLAELRTDPSALARNGVLVVDGETEDDLRRVASVSDRPTLWVGSAGLAHALAGDAGRPLPSNRCARPLVTIVGSRTSLAHAQVAEALRLDDTLRHAEVEAAHLRGGDAAWAAAFSAGTDLVVTIAPDVSVKGEGDETLVERLAAVVSGHEHEIGSLVIVGGQTARATLLALGVQELHVVGEIEPGIARCTDARGRTVITKSGSFGDASTLHRIHGSLRA